MRKWFILVFISALVIGPVTAWGQPENTLGIAAFADLVLPVSAGEESGSQFQVNQAEVDLEGSLGRDITGSMALAYDPAAETFALAVLCAEMDLSPGKEFSALMTVGQFDIPFGIDHRVYASVDRKLVQAPLFVGFTHEGWNDLGVDFNLGYRKFCADIFVINGSNCGRGIVSPIKFVERLDIKRAAGSRVSFTGGHSDSEPAWEAGISSALFHDESDNLGMVLLGADLQASFGSFHCKGEFLQQAVDRGTPAEATHKGYYLQGLYEFGQMFGVVRYDRWLPEHGEMGSPERLSLALGRAIQDGLEFRLEQEIGLSDLTSATWLQMVMDFGSIEP